MRWDDVVGLLAEQTDCEILFIVDQTGNMGKSWLGTYLLSIKKTQIYSTYAFNVTTETEVSYIQRTATERISWGIMEKIKGGCVFSSKYKWKKHFRAPEIVIFLFQSPGDLQKKFSRNRIEILT